MDVHAELFTFYLKKDIGKDLHVGLSISYLKKNTISATFLGFIFNLTLIYIYIYDNDFRTVLNGRRAIF